MSEPRPTAVLLDAGFTLTFPDAGVIARHATAAGVNVDAAALARVENDVRRELARFPWASTRAQEATRPKNAGTDFFHRMLSLAGATAGTASLIDAAAAVWAGHLEQNVWCRVGAGVEAALARLRAAGIRTAVVSNSEGTVEAMLKSVGLGRYLETVVDSWVVGVAKPEPGIFQIALDRLGVPASAAVMLGDVPAVDVEGARAAGVKPILIDPLNLHPTIDVPRVPDVPTYVNQLLGGA